MQSMGFEVLPSSANFVFAKHSEQDAEDLFNGLRKQKIIIRYFDKPRINDFLRISIGTDAEMDLMLGVLRDLIAK